MALSTLWTAWLAVALVACRAQKLAPANEENAAPKKVVDTPMVTDAAVVVIPAVDAAIHGPACVRPRSPGTSVDDAILAAVIPSYVIKTRSVKTVKSHGETKVEDCRGGFASAGDIETIQPSDAGTKPAAVVLARSDLAPGKIAAFIATSSSPGACDSEEGLLAIVHVETERVVVDAVGPWGSHCRGPYSLTEHRVSGEPVWAELEGSEGSGAGTTKHETLYTERDGKLILAKDFEITNAPDLGLTDDFVDSSQGTVTFERDVVVFHDEKTHQKCHAPDSGGDWVCDHVTKKKTVTRYALANGTLTVVP